MNKQQEILNAALKLFVQYGFHGTPTSKIAQEAGVANGTLFHYYKTKDELVVALYGDVKTRLMDSLNSISIKDNSTKAKIKSWFTNSVYWFMDNQNEFIFIQQFHTSPFLSMIAPDEIEKQTKGHVELIKQSIKEKEIKNRPADFILMLASNQAYGLTQYLISNKVSKPKQKELINNSFDMLWQMLV